MKMKKKSRGWTIECWDLEIDEDLSSFLSDWVWSGLGSKVWFLGIGEMKKKKKKEHVTSLGEESLSDGESNWVGMGLLCFFTATTTSIIIHTN